MRSIFFFWVFIFFGAGTTSASGSSSACRSSYLGLSKTVMIKIEGEISRCSPSEQEAFRKAKKPSKGTSTVKSSPKSSRSKAPAATQSKPSSAKSSPAEEKDEDWDYEFSRLNDLDSNAGIVAMIYNPTDKKGADAWARSYYLFI